MKYLSIAAISVFSLSAAALLVLHIKSRRPLRSAAVNMILGIAALAAVNLCAGFTGVRIPLNIYTLPGSAIFGIPAVCAFVVIGTII